MQEEKQRLQSSPSKGQYVDITLSDIQEPKDTTVNNEVPHPPPDAHSNSHTHDHSQCKSHNHNHNHNHNHAHNHSHQGHNHFHGHHGHVHANVIVLLMVIVLIMSSFTMQHFYYNNVYHDFTYILSHRALKFLAFMSIWCFIQVIRGDNSVENIRVKIDQATKKEDIKLRECFFCDNYQLERVIHCPYCMKCVYKMNHHCFWAQNCIGYSNQRSFFLLSVYCTTGCLFNLYSNYLYICTHYDDSTLWSTHGILFYLMWIAQSIMVVTVTPIMITILISQALFILSNTTAIEVQKSHSLKVPFVEWRKKYLEHVNVFDRGEIQNVLDIFGTNFLTFWMPFNRRIRNDLSPQPTHPSPSKYQIHHYNPHLKKVEEQRQEKMRGFVSQVRQLYEGMEVTINGKNVTL